MAARPLHLLVLVLLALALAAGCADAEDDEAAAADALDEAHADDTTDPTLAVREPVIPVVAQEVDYGPAQGYLAEPERPDSVLDARGLDPEAAALPGLVVVHEWWGLNDNVEAMARRLAGEGYRVLAVDLYRGQTADTPEAARELMELAMQDREELVRNLGFAREYLQTTYDTPEVGVMGWCFGGGMTLRAAVALPQDFDAGVIYYGPVADVTREELEEIDMPLLALFGAEDGSIPVESVRQFESTLEELGKDAEVHVYEGAGHAFANPTGNNYVAEAAREAWDETTAFLRQTLYSGAGEGEEAVP